MAKEKADQARPGAWTGERHPSPPHWSVGCFRHDGRPASYAGFPDDLLDRRDALDDLQPAVHAQRQHALFDRGVADLRGTDVLEDQLAQVLGHEHHLVQTLAAAEAGAVALVAALAPEERDLAEARVQREVLE